MELTDAPDTEAITRALKTYLKKGYSLNWINQRLKSIEICKALTDEWTQRGAKAGGGIAGGARKKLEKRLGRSVVSKKNFLNKPESQKKLT